MNWKGARDYILGRLAENSTWVGILTLVGTFGGIAIKPEYAGPIAMVGSGLGSVAQILLKENGSPK